MMQPLDLIFIPLFTWLAVSALYQLFFSVMAMGKKNSATITPVKEHYRRCAILIPAYKEDNVILSTACNAKQQDYPSLLFDVIVIADHLQPETIKALHDNGIHVIEVSFEQSTKARSLNRALHLLPDYYDTAVVLDADNIMHPAFLKSINRGFAQGYRVIQGMRTAKNLNTPIARLDAISEAVNNHIFRKGHCRAGLSSALIGSGMAIDYQMFKYYMSRIDAISGFDKELELLLIRDGIRIHYMEEAVVYDEKVQKSEVFQTQRTRWLAAQMLFASRALNSFASTPRFSKDYLFKILQYLLPPRLMLLSLTAIFTLVSPWLPSVITPLMWFAVFIISSLAILLAIPSKFFSPQLAKDLINLPYLFILMLLALFRTGKARHQFIHTPHTLTQKLEVE